MLDSTLTPPHPPFILEEIKLLQPAFEVLVRHQHSLTLEDPQFFSHSLHITLPSSLSLTNLVPKNLAELQHQGSCDEQTVQRTEFLAVNELTQPGWPPEVSRHISSTLFCTKGFQVLSVPLIQQRATIDSV